jgi:pimeloyl-ACP methyl ester carboxylesterase
MKQNSLWMKAALLCCLTIMGLGSCTNDNVDNSANPGGYSGGGDFIYDLRDVEILDSGVISTMDLIKDVIEDHSMMEDRDDSLYSDWGVSQYAIIDSLNKAGTRAGDGEGWDGAGGTGYAQSAKWVTIRYKSTSVDGSTKDFSELIVYPYNRIRKNPNPKNLIIGCHCTITSNAERPSNFSKLSFRTDVSMLALKFAAGDRNCLVVIPDYEGYGSTHGDPHPYCNRDVTAKQVVDGAKAAVAWYEKNEKKMADGWKAIPVGYSQGGAVAAGTLRYHIRYPGGHGLNMVGAVCGDGPYDPLATLKTYIEKDRLYMPVAPALLLKGAIDTNKGLKALGCTYKDFVTDDFYNTGIFDWLEKKEFTTDEIQTKLLNHSAFTPGGFKMYCWSNTDKNFMPHDIHNYAGRDWDLSNGNAKSYCTVDQCFKPGVIAFFKDGSIKGDVPENKLKALEQALKENSLYYGDYVPDIGAYSSGGTERYTLFHSTGDEVVPVSNMESVRNKWGVNYLKAISYEAGTYLHVGTGAAFYVSYVGTLVDQLLSEGKWATGEYKYTGKFY